MKLALALLALPLFGTTLTGTLSLPNGTGATGTLVLSLAQQGALSAAGGCGGPVEVVPTAQVVITVTNGALIGSPHVYGNDCLQPQGTFYNVTFRDSNGNILMTDRWQISGSSIDIGTIISVVISGTTQSLGSTGVVLFTPTGNQVVNQPAGTTTSVNFFTVTGTLTFPSGASCTAAGCSGLVPDAVTLSTAQTVAGQKTFTSTLLFGPSAGLGNAANPASNVYVQGGKVYAQDLRMYHGSAASPDGFFDLIMLTAGSFYIQDDTGAAAIQYAPLTATGFGLPQWRFAGVMAAFGGTGGSIGGNLLTGGFANATFDSGDLPCSIAPDGMQAIRNDVSPPQLQFCVSHTLYTINL